MYLCCYYLQNSGLGGAVSWKISFHSCSQDMHDLFESINCGPENDGLNECTFSHSLSTLFSISRIPPPHDLCCFCSLIKQMRPRETHGFKRDSKAMTTHTSDLAMARTWCGPTSLSALTLGSLKQNQGSTGGHGPLVNGPRGLIQIGTLFQQNSQRSWN